uniref:Uncharacterized protein n=1 Tax=Tetranychus urticae TaxID=32264 RepID=T1KYQ9_TETUR
MPRIVTKTANPTTGLKLVGYHLIIIGQIPGYLWDNSLIK